MGEPKRLRRWRELLLRSRADPSLKPRADQRRPPEKPPPPPEAREREKT